MNQADTTGTEEKRGNEAQREFVHAGWAAVSGAWGEHHAYADARGAGVARAMLERARPAAGARVLELACGPGRLGIDAADLVGPTGEVVVSDVVPDMVSIATALAAAEGITNVTGAVLDLEDIDMRDEAFDVVLCREGLMFAVDPARAAAEIVRVLRPDGRAAVAVWGARARNPWLGLVFDALTEQLGHPVPPPGVPHPFALDDADELRDLLTTAGLHDVRVTEIDTPLHASGFDEWWTRTTALAGPLALILATLPEDAAVELDRRMRAAVAPYETGVGLTLPGVSLVASGQR